MATNEHFLLVHLADIVNALNRAFFTVDEVIQDVKKARIKAKLKNGARTDSLVMKALRKLVFNNHIRLLDVGGQTGFRFTAHGIAQFKRATKDYPQRKRRAPRSTFSLRARDVSRLGSVLKKGLIKETDDILDEMRHDYLISIRGQNVSPPSPSSSDQPGLHNPVPVQSLLFAELRSADFPEHYPSFRDIASDSESDRPRFSTSESEQEQYSMVMPSVQNDSPSPSLVDFPSSSFGVCCTSPQSFAGAIIPLCESRKGKEKEFSDFFGGPFRSQYERHTPDRSPRRHSLDSDKTLVDSPSLCDYLPFTSLTRGKRVKKSKGDKC